MIPNTSTVSRVISLIDSTKKYSSTYKVIALLIIIDNPELKTSEDMKYFVELDVNKLSERILKFYALWESFMATQNCVIKQQNNSSYTYLFKQKTIRNFFESNKYEDYLRVRLNEDRLKAYKFLIRNAFPRLLRDIGRSYFKKNNYSLIIPIPSNLLNHCLIYRLNMSASIYRYNHSYLS